MTWICSECRHGNPEECKGTVGGDTCFTARVVNVRIAVTEDGKIQVWDKPNGVKIAILDYRSDKFPEVVLYEASQQIGPQGDY